MAKGVLESVFLRKADTYYAQMLHDGRMFCVRSDGAVLVRPQETRDKCDEDVCCQIDGMPYTEHPATNMLFVERMWPTRLKLPADMKAPYGETAVLFVRDMDRGMWLLERTGAGTWRRVALFKCDDAKVMDTPCMPMSVLCPAVVDAESAQELGQIDGCSIAVMSRSTFLVYTSGTQELYLALRPRVDDNDNKLVISLEDGSCVEAANWSDSKKSWGTVTRRVEMGILGSELLNPETGKPVTAEDVAAANGEIDSAAEDKVEEGVAEAGAVACDTRESVADDSAVSACDEQVKGCTDAVPDVAVPEELQPAKRTKKRMYKDVVDADLNAAVDGIATDVQAIADQAALGRAAAEVKVLRDLITKAASRMSNLASAMASYSNKVDVNRIDVDVALAKVAEYINERERK